MNTENVATSTKSSARKSGRCVALWSGTASNGKHYQYAQREDGAFFGRDYGWNGHGRGWGPWWFCADPRRPGTETIDGGFARDPERTTEDLGRIRLPAGIDHGAARRAAIKAAEEAAMVERFRQRASELRTEIREAIGGIKAARMARKGLARVSELEHREDYLALCDEHEARYVERLRAAWTAYRECMR